MHPSSVCPTGFLLGVFDLFHIAHLDTVERAAAGCDRLIVGVATDELVEELCGFRPFVPHIERIEIIGALKVVAAAVPLTDLDLTTVLSRTGATTVFLPAEPDVVQAAASTTFGPLDRARADLLGLRPVRFEAGRRTGSVAVRDALARTTDEREGVA